jgi:hypothetical protein
VKRGLLYLGTENGVYVSFDDGEDWQSLQNNLPHVPAYWLVVQEHFNDLVVGTYGRGAWILRELTIMAQPFDLDRLELSGEPSPIGESVATARNRGAFSVSENSSLAYRVVTDDAQRPGWFDRTGKLLETGASPSGNNPRLSPNGKQIALNRLDPVNGAGDVWLEDVSRRIITRLTSHPGYDWVPVWSPDGNRIAFASNRDATMDL